MVPAQVLPPYQDGWQSGRLTRSRPLGSRGCGIYPGLSQGPYCARLESVFTFIGNEDSIAALAPASSTLRAARCAGYPGRSHGPVLGHAAISGICLSRSLTAEPRQGRG